MKKLDNFANCLAVLADADFKLAETNDIYRTGIIGQFNLTFELAWKALQEDARENTASRGKLLQDLPAKFCSWAIGLDLSKILTYGYSC